MISAGEPSLSPTPVPTGKQGGRVRRSRTFAAACGSGKNKTPKRVLSAAVPPLEEAHPKAAQLPCAYNLQTSLSEQTTSAGGSFPLVQGKPATTICRRRISYGSPYFIVRSTISHAARRISFKLYSRVRIKAAVNSDRRAGDERRIRLIAKEQKRSFQLFRLTETVHRRCGKNLARSCGRCAVLVP